MAVNGEESELPGRDVYGYLFVCRMQGAHCRNLKHSTPPSDLFGLMVAGFYLSMKILEFLREGGLLGRLIPGPQICVFHNVDSSGWCHGRAQQPVERDFIWN